MVVGLASAPPRRPIDFGDSGCSHLVPAPLRSIETFMLLRTGILLPLAPAISGEILQHSVLFSTSRPRITRDRHTDPKLTPVMTKSCPFLPKSNAIKAVPSPFGRQLHSSSTSLNHSTDHAQTCASIFQDVSWLSSTPSNCDDFR